LNLFLKLRMNAWLALQTGRLFLWLPVAMGSGAAVYLSLSFEPGLIWVAIPLVISLLALLAMRRFGAGTLVVNLMVLVAAFCLGAMVCKLRTEHVRAPVISSGDSNYTLKAYVIDIVSPSED
jgi:competence protein ComEC